MTLAVVRERLREGRRPPRDVVLAFLADEEAGGTYGARWLVDNHPELFEGCTEAHRRGRRLLAHGQRRTCGSTSSRPREKGMAWMRLTARGRAGHGSMINDDNAVVTLAEAVARLGRYEWPIRITPTVRAFLDEVSAALGLILTSTTRPDFATPSRSSGRSREIVGATLRNTTNADDARRRLQGQRHPADRDSVASTAASCRDTRRSSPTPSTRSSAPTSSGLSSTPTSRSRPASTGRCVDAMRTALQAEDPGSRIVPYCLSGGTDAKSFSRLGIRCFGFAPLRLPPTLDFTGDVPRRRRAGAGRRAALRRPRARPLPGRLLSLLRQYARRG